MRAHFTGPDFAGTQGDGRRAGGGFPGERDNLIGPGDTAGAARGRLADMQGPYYLIRVRRRWIKMTSTMTKSTPATIRMIVVPSMSNPHFQLQVLLAGLPRGPSGTDAEAASPRGQSSGALERGTRLRRALPARWSATALVNLGAAALDENAEHDDKEHAGDNPDNRGTVHCDPLSEKWYEASIFEALEGACRGRRQGIRGRSGARLAGGAD